MSWFKKPLNIGITIGAAVLAVVVIGLIIYGVTTHTEAGLLQVCWLDGRAHYVEGTELDDGACEGSEELVWPESQIPLAVAAQASDVQGFVAPGASQREALDSAIRDINQQVGFALLTPVGDGAGADVVVHLGEAVDAGRIRGAGAGEERARPLGFARHHRTNSGGQPALRCDLHIYSTVGSLRGEYLVIHHELLHAIGLAHDDDNPASAIYPFTSDDTMWERMQAARITDHDRALIRELYLTAAR